MLMTTNQLKENIDNILHHITNDDLSSALIIWDKLSEHDQNDFVELKSYFKKYIFVSQSINFQIIQAKKQDINDQFEKDLYKLKQIDMLVKENKHGEALKMAQSLEYLEVSDDVWRYLNNPL